MLGGCLVGESDMSSDLRLVLSTCGDRAVADRVAEALVAGRLAACVNVVPGIGSTYRWRGKIERDEEVLLLIKTRATALDAIETTIKAESGYELPELIAVEITGGSTEYLGWVGESVGE